MSVTDTTSEPTFNDKKFVAHVGWGESPEEGWLSDEYRFSTDAELDAFWVGVDAMAGYADYTPLETPSVYRNGEWVAEDGGDE